jgi:hypothetical protein
LRLFPTALSNGSAPAQTDRLRHGEEALVLTALSNGSLGQTTFGTEKKHTFLEALENAGLAERAEHLKVRAGREPVESR